MRRELFGLLVLAFSILGLNCGEDKEDSNARACTLYDMSLCYFFETCEDGVCASSVSAGGGGAVADDDDSECEPGTRHCQCDDGECAVGLTCRSGICVHVDSDDDDSADDDDSTDDDDTDDGWHDDTEQWIKTARCCYLGALSDYHGAFAWSLHDGKWARAWDLSVTFNNDTGLSCYETQINMLDVYGNTVWTDLHQGRGEDNVFLGHNYVPQACWLSGKEMKPGKFDEPDGIDGTGWIFTF